MTEKLPIVSIIIPTKNGGDMLKGVLKAIFENSVTFGFEVIAVDSGSSDCTKDVIAKYPVKLVEIPPQSFSHGGARNLGAENAAGEFLVFLTQDATPRNRSWLSCLIENFNDKAVAGVYGRQIPPEGASPIEKYFLHYLYPDSRIVKNSIDPTDCLLSDIFFSNVNSAIRRSEWEKTRFNEEIIMSEDQEWSKRMLVKGKRIVYEPEAVVVHSHRYNFFTIIGRNFDSGMSLKGMVNASLSRSARYELDYLKGGFRFLAGNKSFAYFPLFPLYEVARLLGFALGFNSDILPFSAKKFLSQNKAYWRVRIRLPPR